VTAQNAPASGPADSFGVAHWCTPETQKNVNAKHSFHSFVAGHVFAKIFFIQLKY
jgi:hypothetical protein